MQKNVLQALQNYLAIFITFEKNISLEKLQNGNNTPSIQA